MKSLLRITFGFFAGLCLLTACNDSDENAVKGFNLDAEEITLGAEGGTEIVNVASDTKWVAKADQPWIQILPANGVGSAECKIVIDSTLRNDIRNATITFQPEGMPASKLKINQTGFGKMIGLSVEEVKLESMGKYGKRYFEVSVTTNVDFNIDIETGGGKKEWITKPNYSVDLNYGARPRTTKLRFEWSMNTEPEERLAQIHFTPKKEEDATAKVAELKVVQEAAPFIGDNRSGDSLALVIMQNKMNGMGQYDTNEKMEYWTGVTLWEKRDKEVQANPAMLGRVRSAEIRMISTKESIPDEVSKLTYIETLFIGSNTNTMLIENLNMGTAICQLKHLKNLTVYAYGINQLPNEFKNLGATLEYLDLSSNNLTTIPSVLTKENFPKLVSINLSAMRRYSSTPNLQTDTRTDLGLCIDANSTEFKNLLKWENLKSLKLQNCLIYGSLPAMMDVPKYTDADIAANDTLKTAAAKLKTIPKVLPNAKSFAINLNYLTGSIPNWVLYHPNLSDWGPFMIVFPQDAGGYDKYGRVPGFSNEPANLDYFYDLFPLKKPTYTEE